MVRSVSLGRVRKGGAGLGGARSGTISRTVDVERQSWRDLARRVMSRPGRARQSRPVVAGQGASCSGPAVKASLGMVWHVMHWFGVLRQSWRGGSGMV